MSAEQAKRDPEVDLESEAAPITVPPLSAMEKVISVATWGACASALVCTAIPVMFHHRLLPHSRSTFFNQMMCKGIFGALGSRWRAVIDPAVDPEGVYMFAQNHVNTLDFVAMYRATPTFKSGLERSDHFRYPLYGQLMRWRENIPVEKGGGSRDKVREAMRAQLAKGRSILAFPEGHRTTTGRVRRFRTGIFMLARDLGLPVVPTAVTGMYEIMQKGSQHLRRGHDVTVYLDAPVQFAGLSDEEVLQAAAQVRQTIVRHVDAHWAERWGQ